MRNINGSRIFTVHDYTCKYIIICRYLQTVGCAINTWLLLTRVAACCLQFEVQAVDSGIPQKSTSVPVIIQVIRDEYAPEFVGAPYTVAAIPENRRVGQQVFKLSGRDRDQKVSIIGARQTLGLALLV